VELVTEFIEKQLIFALSVVFFMIFYYFMGFEPTIIVILLVILSKIGPK